MSLDEVRQGVITRHGRYSSMVEVMEKDYTDMLSINGALKVRDEKLRLGERRTVTLNGPPGTYRGESSTVWSFPLRGVWATHSGSYRGNWSPYIPRNLILRHTVPGQWVLDPMMGSGTTLVECKLLGRNAIGVDINSDAVMIARDRLAFALDREIGAPPETHTFVGDARNLHLVGNETMDLVATHPPYWDIVRYSCGRIESDLSNEASLTRFLSDMGQVARECYRVLRKGGHCGVLMGDTRMRRHVVLISYGVLREFIKAGFLPLEDVIKIQHNTASETRGWIASPPNFLRIAHEHLYILRKPRSRLDAQGFLDHCLVVDPETVAYLESAGHADSGGDALGSRQARGIAH